MVDVVGVFVICVFAVVIDVVLVCGFTVGVLMISVFVVGVFVIGVFVAEIVTPVFVVCVVFDTLLAAIDGPFLISLDGSFPVVDLLVVDLLVAISPLVGIYLRGERLSFVLGLGQFADATIEASSIGQSPLGRSVRRFRPSMQALRFVAVAAAPILIVHYLLVW